MLSLSFPQNCIGSTVKYRVFNLSGKLIYQSAITSESEKVVIKKSTLGGHGTLIFHFMNVNRTTFVVAFSS